ncbi:hypothetical protein ASPVEDRAFT_43942 [Aspergillus versicolor CBS 583.65]|uniref:Zn(2)-C6 fungal-type domain-containing protein n=1 Tax=Aspergillus versicolor CBS 583.65 TaxID=1036611 RepID=A0A1L9PSF2_ASPVE|nr:uncharacterized protein ASPVEDRAFT_43942 [Aspergillus versicolor CBS 583.65]OJJ04464.1 hypothetical protein ASPVEDRAFT_43942 [Aspergillus versicolor CBS 583.65]
MVFPGRRSIGCYTCRQRKVKCDATRPQCSRCTRFGRTCPGYPDNFAFKSYNGVSNRLSSAPKSDSSLQVGSRTDQQAVASIAAPAQLQRDPPSLPPYIPTTCTDSSSLSFFFHHHVLIVEKSPCGGHLAFLPEFYREKEAEPCLRYSILSIGYLSLFKTHRSRIFWVQAASNYSAALAALAAAISTTESAVRDEVFASALFLSMFTNMSNKQRTRVNHHIPGVYALMQARGTASLSGKYARRLLAWAFNQLQIHTMANNEYGYSHFPSLFQDIPRPDSVCRAISLVNAISGLCQSIPDAKKLQDYLPSTFPADPENVVNEIARWEQSLPAHWKRQLQLMKRADKPRNEVCDVNIWTACFLALINSSILTFYNQYLDMCASLVPGSDAVCHRTILERMTESINIICSAVRYTLGDFNESGQFQPLEASYGVTYNLHLPMSLVSKYVFASPDQVSLCTEALRHTEGT